ncbi:hypothetical protein, partial [Staphylococcus aureus]|uniref:hypothetical protein n=1 Tax=Staphylococcus aureus TaxID=1280 RepID=UPI00338F6C18
FGRCHERPHVTKLETQAADRFAGHGSGVVERARPYVYQNRDRASLAADQVVAVGASNGLPAVSGSDSA